MIKQLIIGICLLIQVPIAMAQSITYSGKVIDQETQEAVFGVALMLGNRVICYSDDKGNFTFEVNGSNADKNVVFTHLSYKSKTMSLTALKKMKVIPLAQNYVQLKEVTVGVQEALTEKEILKRAVRQYEATHISDSYWSDFNYKQTIDDNGKPQGFLECDGHILMPGKMNWTNDPIVVPDEMRRLNEDSQLAEIDYKDLYVNARIVRPTSLKHIGSHYMRVHWTNYGAMEEHHPLSKKGFRYFDFTIEQTVYEGGEAYYMIRFVQNKIIPNHGWAVTYMQGRLWVNAATFTLQKLETQFYHQWHSSFIAYTINYTLVGNKLLPSTIAFSNYIFKKSSSHNIVKRGTATLKNIYKTSKKNPFIKGGGGEGFVWYDIQETYHPEYWKNHPLTDPIYKNDVLYILGTENWDEAFKKGASEREYKEHSLVVQAIEFFRENREALLKYMKADLNLKE